TLYKSKKELNKYDLTISLKDSEGKEILTYKPVKLKHPELPEPQSPVKSPDEINSIEDLYLTGQYVEQFHRAGINPDEYYFAALKKSPNDYRVNIALGIRRVKQRKYKEALHYLQTADHKMNIKYYQPKEGKLYYYIGLAQIGLGEVDKAYRSFGRATWYYQWLASGNYELALIDCKRGNYESALTHIKE